MSWERAGDGRVEDGAISAAAALGAGRPLRRTSAVQAQRKERALWSIREGFLVVTVRRSLSHHTPPPWKPLTLKC